MIYRAPMIWDETQWNVERLDSCGGWIARPGDLVRFTMHVGGFSEPAMQ